LVIGDGTSLTTSGSGTIAATSAPAAGITGTVTVAHGGTGAVTLASGQYLKGAGTSAITSTATIPGSDVSGDIAGNAANVNGTVTVATVARVRSA
jgi:hypothetical protein